MLPNALFCSDCDKITSGILMATLRLPYGVRVTRPDEGGEDPKSVKELSPGFCNDVSFWEPAAERKRLAPD